MEAPAQLGDCVALGADSYMHGGVRWCEGQSAVYSRHQRVSVSFDSVGVGVGVGLLGKKVEGVPSLGESRRRHGGLIENLHQHMNARVRGNAALHQLGRYPTSFDIQYHAPHRCVFRARAKLIASAGSTQALQLVRERSTHKVTFVLR